MTDTQESKICTRCLKCQPLSQFETARPGWHTSTCFHCRDRIIAAKVRRESEAEGLLPVGGLPCRPIITCALHASIDCRKDLCQ
jgi:hypothetical protein